MKKLIFTTAIVALFVCANAQTPGNQVTVDVVATNKTGFDKDLSAKDFKIWEDNKEQTVTDASLRPPGKHALVLLFDNSTVSVATQGDLRGYVERFIDASAAPNIYMEVASFFSGIRVLQSFTNNASLLKASLAGTAASGVVSGKAAQPPALPPTSIAPNSRVGPSKDGVGITVKGEASPVQRARNEEMMESLLGLIESLAPIHGRKAIIFFSGGQTFSEDAASAVNAALEAANKANVAIYGISASSDDPTMSGAKKGVSGSGNNGTAFARTFADATGGTAIKQTQYLPDVLHQILQEQDAYYSVTYTSSASGDPAGACHALRVKVDTPGDDARSRKLYCEIEGPDALAGTPIGKDLDAKLAGSPAGTLSVSMQAPWFDQSDQARVDVVLDTPNSGIKFRKEKGKWRGELFVEGAAYHQDGTPAARFSRTVTEEFADQKQADAFSKQPFHYEGQLTVSPGQYTVKAVISASGDVWGKSSEAISVDPINSSKPGMSGIAFSRELRNLSGAAAGLPPDMIEGVPPLVASDHQIVPTGFDRFQQGERVYFYTEYYDPALTGANPPQVFMRFRVLERSSGAVKSDSPTASIANYVQPGNPVVRVASVVPFAQLTSGGYRLEITASHSSGPETVVRSVDFDLN